MIWLLKLYPRAWRARYEAEIRELIATERRTPRLAADLIAGAIDARLNPQWTPGMVRQQQGAIPMAGLLTCNPQGLTRAEQWRQGAWLVGGSFALMLLSIVLSRRFGETSFSEALLYAAFPVALSWSGECSYFKRYSSSAKWTLVLGLSATVFAIVWAAVLLGRAI